jgi:hypothetical protein
MCGGRELCTRGAWQQPQQEVDPQGICRQQRHVYKRERERERDREREL